MSRKDWAAILILALVATGLIVWLELSVVGIDGTETTPTIGLSNPHTEHNNTTTFHVNSVSRNDVKYVHSIIRITLPNSTIATCSIGASGWSGNVTSYHNSTLGVTMTLRAAGSDASPQYMNVGDTITIQSDSTFEQGQWTVSLVYIPTANVMAQTVFEG